MARAAHARQGQPAVTLWAYLHFDAAADESPDHDAQGSVAPHARDPGASAQPAPGIPVTLGRSGAPWAIDPNVDGFVRPMRV
jgi:hypothetical protein